MGNAWLDHVKKFRAKHKDMPYKKVLQEAKKTYKPKAPASASKTTKKAPKSSKKDMPAEE